jgi:hypothetical protein
MNVVETSDSRSWDNSLVYDVIATERIVVHLAHDNRAVSIYHLNDTDVAIVSFGALEDRTIGRY